MESLNIFFGGAGKDGSDGEAAVDHAGSLMAVDILELTVCNRDFTILSFKICALAADHTENTGIF